MSGPALVYLLRHGQTDWNASGRFLGSTDHPINARGARQAAAAARALRGARIARIVASPLVRAQATAGIVRAALGVRRRVESDPRLREFDMGIWEGATAHALRRDRAFAAYCRDPRRRAPGGESAAEVQARAAAALRALRPRAGEGPLLIVTHNGVIKVLLARVLNLPLRHFWLFRIDNCALTVLDFAANPPRVAAVNWRPDFNYSSAR